jgi:pectate lyase
MQNVLVVLIFLWISISSFFAQDTLIIQENESGFCSVDGTVVIGSTNVTGWTGTGYADSDPGIGKSMSWQISVAQGGTYTISWRYAIGGNPGSRDAKLLINGIIVRDSILFPHTGTWSNWMISSPIELNLTAGSKKIRIEAYSTSGLGNYDYLMVTGNGVSASVCNPSYTISVKSNNEEWGSVTYKPIQPYYEKGTLVTLTAASNHGYFFQSWLGDETSADSVYSFTVKSNVNAVARFLPDGTKMDSTIIGYATVQDDKGTPYLVTGGSLGDTVTAETLSDLQNYLGSSNPYVVKFSGELTGIETISIASDKTFLGVGDGAHLRGIEVSVNQARNVIIKNITISHVTPQDALEINGKSKNIVIDHCEFYSDRLHGKDYYDGLLDIKNESSFITVSRSCFHDHFKVCLISSGDQQVADSVIRVTFHHNYFYNCGPRLPSIRFGKAHIFNNYFKDSDDAVNSRMNACVKVEKNYFENIGKAVFTDNSSYAGYVQLVDNHFGSSSFIDNPECDLQVPYPYNQYLNETNNIPDIIPGDVRITDEEIINENLTPGNFYLSQNYPNPFNLITKIKYSLPEAVFVDLSIYNVIGEKVKTIVSDIQEVGSHIVVLNTSDLSTGIYFYRIAIYSDKIRAGIFIKTKKFVLLK